MKIERTKNAGRNILFGTVLKIYQTAVPFLMRTAMVYFMGVQYLGLNSLFVSILQVLNLAELGVGNAMVYSMYGPVAHDNRAAVCALLRLYRTYYRAIGLAVAVMGIALTPSVPWLIKGGVPVDVNIYVLYWLNLAAAVLSYWLCAYKSSLLQAHQRTDVVSKVTFFTDTVKYALQFLVLVFLKNYYLYVLVALAAQAMANIITARAASLMYPDYKPVGQLPHPLVAEINGRIRDLFTAKIGAVVVSSADSIVISAFLGLEALAVYQNYFCILSAVSGFGTVIFNACTAGIGNSIIVETKEKNLNDLKKFTLMAAWAAGMCAACLLCLYQPFMEIWVGKGLKLGFPAVIYFCVYYFVYEMHRLLNTYKDAAGIWHEDRFRPLVTSFANLGMNLAMVRSWGIYGVLLSTVLSILLVGMPWLVHNLFTVLFDKSQLVFYIRRLGLYACTAAVACAACWLLCCGIRTSGWEMLAVRGILCGIVSNGLFFAVYHKLPEFGECVRMAVQWLHC